MGHDASLYWHRSSGKMDAARSLGYGWLITAFQLVLFLLGSVFSMLLTGKLLLSRMEVDLFPIEAAYFLGLILTERYITFFYSSGKAALCNKILTLAALFTLLLPGILYFFMIRLLPNPLVLFCLIPLLHGMILLIAFHRDDSYPGMAWPERSILSSLFKFSIIVFATNLIQFFAYRIDYWMISYFTSQKGQVGLYAQASRFAQLLWVIPNIIAAIVYHDLTSGEKQSGKNKMAALVRAINFINLLLIPCLVGVTWIILNYFLIEYVAAFRVFLFFLAGMFLFCHTILLAAYFSASKDLRINFFISLFCLVLIALLDLLFIPRFGIRGAAWAQTIAYGASGVASLLVFSKREKVGLTRLLIPGREDLISVKGLFLNA
jgi:hypothetical protein